jgi:large subunit ribosomal protein L21
MYAVIDIGGKQIKVSPDQNVRVAHLDLDVGSQITFDRVYAVRRDDEFEIGSPTVKGARVVATVVNHGKAGKVTVYKYKRRKFYRRKRGHRQPFTEVKISEIVV